MNETAVQPANTGAKLTVVKPKSLDVVLETAGKKGNET